MKRGFLNSKKVKDKPLYDDGASRDSPAVIAPPKQLAPLGGCAPAIPCMRPFISESLIYNIFSSKEDIKTSRLR